MKNIYQRKLKGFERRRDTLKKKAGELSSLCNVDVCLLCVGPTGDLASWPEDPAAARSVIGRYNEACDRVDDSYKAKKINLTVSKVLSKRKQPAGDKATADDLLDGSVSLPFLWDEQLLAMSEGLLLRLSRCLESKIQDVNGRIGFLNAKQAPPQEMISQSVDLSSQPHQIGQWMQNYSGPTEQPNTYSAALDQTICGANCGNLAC